MGGLVVKSYLKDIAIEVKQNQYQGSQEVLEEAKRALLQYAYNYPEINGNGPGRLPCADTDNNGLPNSSFGDCISIGRFPWDDPNLKTQELKDSSGERLWYVASPAFASNVSGGNIINIETRGTITLVDQTGSIIYDGAVAGVAAIVIAPGAPIKRDEDNDGVYEYSQKRGTEDEQKDAKNYLDTFDGFDNSVYNNSESDSNDDGFIIGPVFDPNINSYVINDQMVVITADELTSFAFERAVVEIKTVFDDFISKTGQYPWLFEGDYNDSDFDFSNPESVDLYKVEANVNTLKGQVPMLIDNGDFGTELQFKWKLQNSTPVSDNGFTEIDSTDLKEFDEVFPVSSYLTDRCTWQDDYKVNCATSITLIKWKEETSPGIWDDCGGDASTRSTCVLTGGEDVRKYTLTATDDIDFSSTISPVLPALPIALPYEQASLTDMARINIKIENGDIDSVLLGQKYPITLEIIQYDDIGETTASETASLDLSSSIIYSATPADYLILQTRYFPQADWFAKNFWQKYIIMEYIASEQPGSGAATCISGNNCISVTDRLSKSVRTDAEVIVLASGLALSNQDRPSANIIDYFEGENIDDDKTYIDRELNGNDRVVIIKP